MNLYLRTDNLIIVDELRNAATGIYVNSAVVRADVLNANLEPLVDGAAIQLAYVQGSDGKYQGVLPYTLALNDGETYYVDLTISDTNRRFDRIRCKAQYASGT